ncbi:MAG: BPSS1780 family membrane protein [Rhodocyclaceae bacterium]
MESQPLQAVRLPAARGWGWLVEGARLWRRNPRTIMLLAPCYWLLALVTFGIPVIGPILGMLLMLPMQIWIYLLCRAVDQNGANRRPRKVRIHVKGLLKLWVVTVVVSIALGWLADLLSNALFAGLPANIGTIGESGDMEAVRQIATEYSGAILGRGVLFLLIGPLPLQMALWFAPVLVGLCEVPPVKAMVFSIIACWRNMWAFGLFGIVTIIGLVIVANVLAVAAVISQALAVVLSILALMMCLSIMLCSVYISVRDVFGDLGARAEIINNG